MRNSSCFFLQNLHLNLLRCRCRNTKHFSASLHNCKLVEIAITDQNAWAFGDESPRLGNMDPVPWILCNTSVAWQRLHMVLVKSALEATKLYWKRRSSQLSSAVSYLYCKLNGKRVSDQRSKCWRNAHERFQWSFRGCLIIREYLISTAAYLGFWITVPWVEVFIEWRS